MTTPSKPKPGRQWWQYAPFLAFGCGEPAHGSVIEYWADHLTREEAEAEVRMRGLGAVYERADHRAEPFNVEALVDDIARALLVAGYMEVWPSRIAAVRSLITTTITRALNGRNEP